MKIILALSGSGLALGGLYAGGVLTTGEVYELSPSDARMKLEAMPLQPDLISSAAGSDSATVRPVSTPSSITWNLDSATGAGAKFVAHLEPEGPGRTRVRIEYTRAADNSDYGERLLSTGFMRSYAETFFAERVDAQLEGRPFNQHRAMTELGRQAASNPENVRELGEAVNGIFTEVSAQAVEATRGTAEPPITSAAKQMDAATRPMITLPPQP